MNSVNCLDNFTIYFCANESQKRKKKRLNRTATAELPSTRWFFKTKKETKKKVKRAGEQYLYGDFN